MASTRQPSSATRRSMIAADPAHRRWRRFSKPHRPPSLPVTIRRHCPARFCGHTRCSDRLPQEMRASGPAMSSNTAEEGGRGRPPLDLVRRAQRALQSSQARASQKVENAGASSDLGSRVRSRRTLRIPDGPPSNNITGLTYLCSSFILSQTMKTCSKAAGKGQLRLPWGSHHAEGLSRILG